MKIKKRQNIKRKARVIKINLVMEMKCSQLLHQKERENATLIATVSQAIWSKHPVKNLCKTARAEKAKKLNEEGSSKGLINVVDKQIKLLLEAQERDDKMMERLIQLEETPKERQKEILMTIINKL